MSPYPWHFLRELPNLVDLSVWLDVSSLLLERHGGGLVITEEGRIKNQFIGGNVNVRVTTCLNRTDSMVNYAHGEEQWFVRRRNGKARFAASLVPGFIQATDGQGPTILSYGRRDRIPEPPLCLDWRRLTRRLVLFVWETVISRISNRLNERQF
jgi:hypothetical protein